MARISSIAFHCAIFISLSYRKAFDLRLFLFTFRFFHLYNLLDCFQSRSTENIKKWGRNNNKKWVCLVCYFFTFKKNIEQILRRTLVWQATLNTGTSSITLVHIFIDNFSRVHLKQKHKQVSLFYRSNFSISNCCSAHYSRQRQKIYVIKYQPNLRCPFLWIIKIFWIHTHTTGTAQRQSKNHKFHKHDMYIFRKQQTVLS